MTDAFPDAPAPPAGYRVRGATKDDFDAVFSVITEADTADWGAPDFTESALRFEWSLPQLDLSTDTWVIEPDGGAICGYAWLLSRDEHRLLDGWTVVLPAHRGRGLEELLVELVERRAREHASEAALGADVRLHVGAIEPDRAGHALLEARGLTEVRHFWKMAVRLDAIDGGGGGGGGQGEQGEPRVPDGIRIRTFVRGADERTLFDVHVDSFTGHWGWVAPAYDDWVTTNLGAADFDPTLCYLAIDADRDVAAGELVGGIQGNEGWVHTIGVRPGWRGRGIAAALLQTAFAEFRRRNVPEAVLDVDAENATGAVGLYERVGMRQTRRYDVYERRLVGSGPASLPAEGPEAAEAAEAADPSASA